MVVDVARRIAVGQDEGDVQQRLRDQCESSGEGEKGQPSSDRVVQRRQRADGVERQYRVTPVRTEQGRTDHRCEEQHDDEREAVVILMPRQLNVFRVASERGDNAREKNDEEGRAERQQRKDPRH